MGWGEEERLVSLDSSNTLLKGPSPKSCLQVLF